MSQYPDLFFRPNLSSTGQIPADGPLTTCPDIIIGDVTPIPNFQTALATPDSYAQDYGNSVQLGMDNYFYVRGKNGGASSVTRQISMYYMPNAVINWPIQWFQNNLLTASGGKSVTVTDLPAGAIGVGSEALIWRQVPPPPAGSDHYCLMSYATDPANPKPIPGTNGMTYEDMGALITNDLSFGWKNIVLVDVGAPTWTYNQMLTVPASTPEAKTVHIYVSCTGFQGASVSFQSSSQEGSSGPIALPQTTITSPNIILGTTVTLQPGFSSSITVNFWSNGITPQTGSTIDLEAAYDPDGDAELASAKKRGLVNTRFKEAMSLGVGITPSNPIYLGRVRYKAV